MSISKSLLYSVTTLGIGIFLIDLKNMFDCLFSEEDVPSTDGSEEDVPSTDSSEEDVPSTDSGEEDVSYVYSIECKKDSEPRLVIRVKVEKNN